MATIVTASDDGRAWVRPRSSARLRQPRSRTAEARRPLPLWAQRVRGRADEIGARVDFLVADGHLNAEGAARIRELLDNVTELAEHSWRLRAWKGFRDWWYGSSAEAAWYHLHLAERLMVASVADEQQVVALVAHRTATLPTEDRRVVAYQALSTRVQKQARQSTSRKPPAPQSISTADRAVVDELLDHSIDESCRFNQSARAFRNRLFLLSFFALLATGLAILVQAWVPETTILKRPAEGGVDSNVKLMTIVAAFGMLGGLVSAIPSLGRASRELSAFNVGMQRALQKAATGGLTAIVGVIALSNASVTTGYASLQSLLAVAIAFGAAQQVVTKGLDDHATDIVRSAPHQDGSAALRP